MQPSTLLLTLAASTTARIIPLDTRATNAQGNFNVTNFYVDSIYADNDQASYSLDVSYAGVSTSCTTKTTPRTSNTFCGSQAPEAPAINGFNTLSCNNKAFSWSFVNKTVSGNHGYQLSLHYTASGTSNTLTACRYVPESDFFCFSQGDTHGQDGESKKGPNNFTASAISGTCG